MAYGPCSALVHGGAWPMVAPLSKGADQGAGDGEWNAGNPMVRSPELGRQ
jgi:hypothetical protein